ncbi:rhodanese-like domain-containing protein [[Acholeplasma] multilocale]|uniref:rhodanese-like domain-containing protein n=1 Tax=[Acholeplasma] multilocale TaxID=264638 RepID=UPI00047E6709|nr:rhodanese-like domain-containing protein [[Acholeplasma] multilocale]
MKNTNWQDYQKLVEEGYELIDIREPYETEKGFAPGATLIPGSVISEDISVLDKDKKYIISCQSGGRSNFMIQQLVNHGYDEENLVNMVGGYGNYLLTKDNNK